MAADDPTHDHIVRLIDLVKEHRQKLDGLEDRIFKEPVQKAVGAAAPIQVHAGAEERVQIFDLVDESVEETDCLTRRIVIVLTSLGQEMEDLSRIAEDQYFAPVALFGWSKNDDSQAWPSGELEAMVGRMLPLFQDIANFAQRCRDITLNAVQQLSMLFNPSQGAYKLWHGAELRGFFSRFGAMLRCCLTLDYLVKGNEYLEAGWKGFQRLVQTDGSAGSLGADAEKLDVFRDLVLSLDEGVLAGRLFDRMLRQRYDGAASDSAGSAIVRVESNRALHEEMMKRAVAMVRASADAIGTEKELNDALELVNGMCLYALVRAIMPPGQRPDESIYQDLWKTQMAVPVVSLFGSQAVFLADEFLKEYAPIPGLAERKLRPADPRAHRSEAYAKLSSGIPAVSAALSAAARAWAIRCEMVLTGSPMSPMSSLTADGVLSERSHLVVQGVTLAHTASRTMHDLIALQTVTEEGLRISSIESLARIAESLKHMEATMKKHEAVIAVSLPLMIKQAMIPIVEAVEEATKRLQRGKRDEVHSMVDSSRVILEALLDSTDVFSPQRRMLLLNAATIFAQKSPYLKDQLIPAAGSAVFEILVLSAFQELFSRACDCRILYFVRDIVPPVLTSISDSPESAGRALLFIAAMLDSVSMLSRTYHLPAVKAQESQQADADPSTLVSRAARDRILSKDPRENLITALERFLRYHILEIMVKPLCKEVEADARLQVHTVLLKHMSPPSPKDTLARSTGVLPRPKAWLLDLGPIRLVSTVLVIKAEVEAYLESTFYDLTAVALHDWRTYGEMAALIRAKYGVALPNHRLPMGSVETAGSDLDVLQIMRAIHVFVRRYNYNLHEQVFVERSAEDGAKHLNAVTVPSISGSILQHGTGMLNTTVNFAFQFLSKRCFPKVIAFLSDEHVTGLLGRERRWFKKNGKDVGSQFPMTRASEMVKEFRKFGLTVMAADKQSCLDVFRRLVTEIGNALGYVRMVRTAGMRHSADAVRFIPDLQGIVSFESHSTAGSMLGKPTGAEGAPERTGPDMEIEESATKSSGEKPLSDETISSAGTLDRVVGNLLSSFGDETEYLQLLVEAFRDSMSKAGTQDAADAAGSRRKKKSQKGRSPLENFSLIVPPMTISFIDAFRAARDQLDKAHKGKDAYFCDDGFAVGLAFLLAVLNQDESFDSLHWFESIESASRDEAKAVEEARAGVAKGKSSRGKVGDEGELTVQELDFKERRIVSTARDNRSLSYSLFAARIFFRMDDEDLERAKKATERVKAGLGLGSQQKPASGSSAPDSLGP